MPMYFVNLRDKALRHQPETHPMEVWVVHAKDEAEARSRAVALAISEGADAWRNLEFTVCAKVPIEGEPEHILGS